MITRRLFGSSAMAAIASSANAQKPAQPSARLGIDLFSLRSQGWDAWQLLEYAAKQGAKVVHYSELRFIGAMSNQDLDRFGKRAQELGVEIEIGMNSICRTSRSFNASKGSVDEQFAYTVSIAKKLKSPIVRCYLGTFQDREPAQFEKNPIGYHIEVAAKFLASQRSLLMDAGIKAAVENHAGDMQARELKMLVEEAGTEHVGVCIDSGNPLWTLEDPHQTLEMLAPYVVTSHVRDSYVWRDKDGIQVEWVRSGEGNVDLAGWIQKFQKLCPGKALSAEVICIPARRYAIYNRDFWKAYETVPASDFSRFLKLTEGATPRPEFPKLSKEEAVKKEREDLEASMVWMKKVLAS
jgi:3-oxoisoapionate decarboxylase